MKREAFVKAAAAAGLDTRGLNSDDVVERLHALPDGPIARRPYQDGVELSIAGFGGIVVVGMEQSQANRCVAASVDRGVNYFDVAPSYFDGEAEMKLGPALEPHREGVFLACKTGRRDAAGATEELERSLKRLRTDRFDLYQLHAMTTMEDVDQVLGPGGALESFAKAREQGKVKYLGFSAHAEEAALALMDRFAFDSVLFPINFVCMSQGGFGPAVLARARERGVARLALKAMAHTPWPNPEAKQAFPKCWYSPVDQVALAARALRYTLSQDITAAVLPGDERLYELGLDLLAGFTPLTEAEQAELTAEATGTEPIFRT
jgi:aryl-alcohol dehydrogenase-like predicted oxidoreductase